MIVGKEYLSVTTRSYLSSKELIGTIHRDLLLLFLQGIQFAPNQAVCFMAKQGSKSWSHYFYFTILILIQ